MVKALITMKKVVQFGTDEQIETFEVESLKDHSTIWWTRQEVREIEDESETLLHFMNINMNNNTGKNDLNQHPLEIDPKIHAVRGLEKRTEIGAWEVYEVQRDARNSVLNQQDKHRKTKPSSSSSSNKGTQRISGKTQASSSPSFDQYSQHQIHEMHEAIAKVYRVATQNARRAAYEIGLKDQMVAKMCFLEMESTGIPFHKHPLHEATMPSPPILRQSSKTVIMTAEPICTKNRSMRQHLIDPLPDTAPSSSDIKPSEDLPLKLSSHSHTSERIGTAPRPRAGISPLKKRRPKLNLENVVAGIPVTPLKGENEPDATLVASPRRKKLDDLLIHFDMLHEHNEATTDLTVSAVVTPTRRKKTIRIKKVDDSVALDVNVLDMQHETDKSTTDITASGVVSPTRRKKTVRKKKVDDTVVLDENVLKLLQDNNTVAITKKKKKKKKSVSSSSSSDGMHSGSSDHNEVPRPKRKSPKRTTSRDSSKGNCTADTEMMMFDTSSSSCSFDHSFTLFEFHTGEDHTANDSNPHHGHHESCKNFSSENIPHSEAVVSSLASLHHSFITI